MMTHIGGELMSTKRVKQAKQKWDAELASFNALFEEYYKVHQQMQEQRQRVHEAYEAYRKLTGDK